MRRREFITLVGGAAVAWPLAAHAQQPEKLPVVGFVSSRSLDGSARHAAAFAKGLSEPGYIEGQNAVIEYHWLGGQNDRLTALMGDLVRRRVAAIATLGDPSTLAAKAATTTIPIAFGFSGDPVGHGLVASLARPGGNATGINFFTSEVLAKRLGLSPCYSPTARFIWQPGRPGSRVASRTRKPKESSQSSLPLRGSLKSAPSGGPPAISSIHMWATTRESAFSPAISGGVTRKRSMQQFGCLICAASPCWPTICGRGP